MDNKNVGWLVLGIAVVMIFVVFLFNNALQDIVNATCSEAGHGDSCPMYETISRQTNLSLVIVGILILVGGFLILSKPNEKIVEKTVIKKVTEKRKPIDVSNLDSDEKKVVELLQKEGNAIFQADLMEKLGKGKVGITRLLDKLEAKQIIERKRRGMNNIVVLR